MPIIGSDLAEKLFDLYVIQQKGLVETAMAMGWGKNGRKAKKYLLACGISIKPRGPPEGERNPIHSAIKRGTWSDPAKRLDVRFRISRAKLGQKNAAWKDGRTPGHRFIRNELQRLGYDLSKCTECGSETKRIHIHHVDGNPWNNVLSNIKLLCSACHVHAHGRIGEKIKITCSWCGREIEDYKSNRIGNKHNFCSRVCHAEWIRKNPLKYWLGKKRPGWSKAMKERWIRGIYSHLKGRIIADR